MRPLAQLQLSLGRELRVDGLGELRDAAAHGVERRLAPQEGLRLRDLLRRGLVHVGLVVAVEVDARALAPAVRRDGRHEPRVPAIAVAVVVAALADVGVFDDPDAALLKLGSGALCGCPCAGRLTDRRAFPVALLRQDGHHVVFGEHIVVFAHERHGLDVQVHGVRRHQLRAAHVGLGLLLGDVGAHGRVRDRHAQGEHRLDAAPALGLGQLAAVVVLRVEDLRDPGVVPAVHHVGVGLFKPERLHGGGPAVPGDQLVGASVGHHDEWRDLAVHLDAAGEPRDIAQFLAVLVAALDAR